MFEELYPNSPRAIARHKAGAFLDERARYLAYCASRGGTHFTLLVKARELLWAAQFISPSARRGLNQAQLDVIAAKRSGGHLGIAANIHARFVNIVRPWLRFLGWWRERRPVVPFRMELDQYRLWMQQERGLADSTVYEWGCMIKRFLLWYAPTKRSLSALRPNDIDKYLVHLGTHGWNRLSVRGTAKALRCFLRYAASGRGANLLCHRRSEHLAFIRMRVCLEAPDGVSWSNFSPT
jgi:hypothetical protein